MGALNFLDLVIGLTFIYFLLSIICFSLQELKANLFNERSRNLEKWIKDTFNPKEKLRNKPGLGDRIWSNILVDGLTQSNRTPSYIPKEVMISVLLDEIYYGSDDSIKEMTNESSLEVDDSDFSGLKPTYDFHSLRSTIENPAVCLPKPFQRVIRQVYSESHENLETFRMRLERWYEMAMDRNSGTYKKKTQRWAFLFAIVVTVAINVDSIQLASHFYDNPDEAKKIADQAEIYLQVNSSKLEVNDSDFKKSLDSLRQDISRINELKLPLGWERYDLDLGKKEDRKAFWVIVWKSLPGWIITFFAVSLGSAFWFDMLNKLVNLRAAGKMPNGGNPPPSSNENKSQSTVPAVG